MFEFSAIRDLRGSIVTLHKLFGRVGTEKSYLEKKPKKSLQIVRSWKEKL